MLICKTNLHKKIMDLYLNYSLRKSRFPLNLTDISNYRVASLLKRMKIVEESQTKVLCLFRMILFIHLLSQSFSSSKLQSSVDEWLGCYDLQFFGVNGSNLLTDYRVQWMSG